MTRRIRILLIVAVGGIALAATPLPPPLAGGAPSIEALLDAFVAAVEARDLAALHRLRVTKKEYLDIVVPGGVAPGQPPRQVSEQPREFFWQLNDTKSRYAAEAIVQRYGGREYASRALRLSNGTHDYLWYRTHGQVRLDLVTADGQRVELRTGSIAEVDGRYKFLAFQWDD